MTPPRPQPAKRAAILEAALALFAAQGVDGTPVPAVAQAAGVAAGTIYTYFPSKEALVNALYREWKSELLADLTRDFPLTATPRAQFGYLWRALARFQARAPKAFAFLEMHHHAPYLDQESQELAKTIDAFVGRFVDAAAAQGALKPLGPELTVALVMGAFTGLVKHRDLGRLPVDDTVLAKAEEALWDAVATRNP